MANRTLKQPCLEQVYTPRGTTGIQTPRTSLPATSSAPPANRERASGGPQPPSLSHAAMLETAAMTQRLAAKLQLLEAAQHAESERSAALERHYQYMQARVWWGENDQSRRLSCCGSHTRHIAECCGYHASL